MGAATKPYQTRKPLPGHFSPNFGPPHGGYRRIHFLFLVHWTKNFAEQTEK